MKHILLKITGISFALIMIGCSTHDHSHGTQNSKEELPTIAVTQWTQKMEIFMEYPVMVKNMDGKFIIHFTFLDDFQPVRDGNVTLEFVHSQGEKYEFQKDELLREGIFTPVLKLPLTGKYDFTITYHNSRMDETFTISDFVVYESEKHIPNMEEVESGEISFLKEQQWKIEFETVPTRTKSIRQSIQAIGEILPKQSQFAEIISPVDGILRIEDNQNMAIPGHDVSVDQTVALLAPALGANNSWVDRKLSFDFAKKEYERAKRLRDNQAISTREFEEIKHTYLIQKAGIEKNTQSDESTLFQVRSPIKGVVTEVSVIQGQKVAAGEKLMTVINPSAVWLRTDVFEKDYYEMDTPNGASISVPGLLSPVNVSGNSFSLLSMGITLNSQSRTIPVLLEIENTDGILKIGQTVQVTLYTETKNRFPAVSETAIFEDETNKIVFIHSGGETFEKRNVQTGNKDMGWVAIVSGLEPGERVVTKGGYLVKLASTSDAVGHPHAH